MTTTDPTRDLDRLLWGVPFLLTLHHLEEALGAASVAHLSRRYLPLWLAVDRRSFLWRVAAVTAGVWVLALLGRGEGRRRLRREGSLGVQGVVCVNAVMPHLLASTWLRRYTPGVATAALLNIPFSLYLWRRVRHARHTAAASPCPIGPSLLHSTCEVPCLRSLTYAAIR